MGICGGLDYLGIVLDKTANLSGDPMISTGSVGVAVEVRQTDEEAMIAGHIHGFMASQPMARKARTMNDNVAPFDALTRAVCKASPVCVAVADAAQKVVMETLRDAEAAARVVALVREGKADVMMKGNRHTDIFMRAPASHGLNRYWKTPKKVTPPLRNPMMPAVACPP